MSDVYISLNARAQALALCAFCTHCIIHREALASRELSPELNDVVKIIVNTVNYIKTRPLKSHIFKIL